MGVVIAVAWGIARVTHKAFIYPLVAALARAGLDIHMLRDPRNVVLLVSFAGPQPRILRKIAPGR